jgi:hypothetical protein
MQSSIYFYALTGAAALLAVMTLVMSRKSKVTRAMAATVLIALLAVVCLRIDLPVKANHAMDWIIAILAFMVLPIPALLARQKEATPAKCPDCADQDDMLFEVVRAWRADMDAELAAELAASEPTSPPIRFEEPVDLLSPTTEALFADSPVLDAPATPADTPTEELPPTAATGHDGQPAEVTDQQPGQPTGEVCWDRIDSVDGAAFAAVLAFGSK